MSERNVYMVQEDGNDEVWTDIDPEASELWVVRGPYEFVLDADDVDGEKWHWVTDQEWNDHCENLVEVSNEST
jgi:hypothetical protein